MLNSISMMVPISLSAIAIFGLLLSQTVFAQVAPFEFTWDQYTGTTHWGASVTVDEGGCGGDRYTHRYSVSVTHNLDSAVISDFGHGALSGTFFGNHFTSPSRSFPDGGGTTTTSSASFDFSSDCSSFTGGYTWHYVDSYQECDGTTSLIGTRTDATTCEALSNAAMQQLIVDAGAVLNEVKETQEQYDSKEFDYTQHLAVDPNFMNTNEYQQMKSDLGLMDRDLTTKTDVLSDQYESVLAKDPKNFWANWDYAALKATRGDYGSADKLYYEAVSTLDENARASVIADLQTSTQGRLSIVAKPTIETSPFIANIHEDVRSSWRQRLDVAVQKVMGDDELDAEKLTITAVLAKMGGVYGRYKEYNECVSGSGGTTTGCVVDTLIKK
jgi:hypothetical protein